MSEWLQKELLSSEYYIWSDRPYHILGAPRIHFDRCPMQPERNAHMYIKRNTYIYVYIYVYVYGYVCMYVYECVCVLLLSIMSMIIIVITWNSKQCEVMS